MRELTRIVFVRDGYPYEPPDEASWREAMRSGVVTPDTIVTVYRPRARPVLLAAGDTPELQHLFEAAGQDGQDGQEGQDGQAEQAAAPPAPEAAPLPPAPPFPASVRHTMSEWPWIRRNPPRRSEEAQDDPATAAARVDRRHVIGGVAVVALAGAAAAALVVRTGADDPAASSAREGFFRVVSDANLRRRADLLAERVKTLRRGDLVKGTVAYVSQRPWVRVSRGEDAGLFLPLDNVERADAADSDLIQTYRSREPARRPVNPP